MAHGRPWYKRNGSDFLFAAMSMPDAEHKWAYSAIIDMLNDRDRAIPDDAAFICGFTGLSRKKWAAVRAWLLAHRNADGEPDKLLLNDAGDITNPRFERERLERIAERDAAAANGRKGGKKSAAMRAQPDLPLTPSADDRPVYRADKHPDSTPDSPPITPTIVDATPANINDLAQAPPQASRARKEARGESLEEEDRESAALRTPVEALLLRLPELTRSFANAAGVAAGPHRPKGWADAMDEARVWLNLGLDPDTEIIPALQDDATRSGGARGSLRYFTRRFTEMAARKAKPNGSAANDRPAEPRSALARAVLRQQGRGADR
jgi:uncharacterized protein YdaU (DUF1376 family)